VIADREVELFGGERYHFSQSEDGGHRLADRLWPGSLQRL
jgi:hypothetical protein